MNDHGDLSEDVQENVELEAETNAELSDLQLESDMQIQEASSALEGIEGLDAGNWQALDANDRLAVLQNVEDRMAGIQGRSSVSVSSAELGEGVFGGYDGQQININTDHLQGNEVPVSEFLDTIVHEGRHAYQDFAIRNPGTVGEGIAAAWSENMQNYLTVEEYGPEAYQNQPVEADAWSYAGRLTETFNNRPEHKE